MKTITISSQAVSMEAELDDSQTAEQIWSALPLECSANTWGDEIYFEIPLVLDLAPDARADVEVGDLGYWPTGNAFCIFFGPTPMSSGNAPRAASPVNVFGRVSGDATQFKAVADGDIIRIEKY